LTPQKEKKLKSNIEFKPEELKAVPKLRSDRIFKSATPKYTTDWYLKWFSSAVVLAAMSIRGVPELALWDLILSVVGIAGWLGVSIMWRDRALIIINSFGLLFLIRNLVQTLLV
jgi:hypothetical protein